MQFYAFNIMNMQICGKLSGHTTFISRVQETCIYIHNVSLPRYVIDVKTEIRRGHYEPDGLTHVVFSNF